MPKRKHHRHSHSDDDEPRVKSKNQQIQNNEKKHHYHLQNEVAVENEARIRSRNQKDHLDDRKHKHSQSDGYEENESRVKNKDHEKPSRDRKHHRYSESDRNKEDEPRVKSRSHQAPSNDRKHNRHSQNNDFEEAEPRIRNRYHQMHYNDKHTRQFQSDSNEEDQPRSKNRYQQAHFNDREPRRHSQNDGNDPGVRSKNLEKKSQNEDILTNRTGGAYIPPAKLKLLQAQITDKSSVAYQRIAWEALKKSINGLINKVNVSNIGIIVKELFKENVIRGRGLLSRSIMQAQAASPTFAHVYAALVAVINTKFPRTGELILKRLIIQFRRGFRRNDKQACLSSTRFIAHLINQQVAHEVVALEILTLLLETPTNDSVEIAIGFLKECGKRLKELTPRGVSSIFEALRNIIHEGQLDTRIHYMIEVMFAIRKDGYKDYPSVIPELDLVEEDEQITHLITLEEADNPEDILNVFKADPEYEANEEKYQAIREDILDESSSGSEDSNSDGEDDDDNDKSEDDEDENNESQKITDYTETNLIALRRTIYLTIQSSLDFEECAHKLIKMEFQPKQIVELCHMILDCCAQQRTYEKFFGLLAQRFCQLNKTYVEPFEELFRSAYDTIHRFETNKLRNVAKLFAHLLYTDAIDWTVLSHIKLNEEDTTSSSRIFIKILFQELCEYMGLLKLNERVKDVTLQEAFDGLFPRDNPHNSRFSINFFTSIGLGGLTDDLREHLKSVPKAQPQGAAQQQQLSGNDGNSPNNSEISEDSSRDSESSLEESSDSSSEEEIKRKRHKNKKKSKRKS